MRTFTQILFFFVLMSVSFYFILFDLKGSHGHMPVGVPWLSIKRLATSFVDFAGATYVWPQVPDYPETVVFLCCVVAYACASLLTDNPPLFFVFIDHA